MIASPMQQLVWKEYRSARAFWLAIVVLVLAAQVVTLWLSTNPAWSVLLVCNMALAAPAFFALGCAGAAFAVEREEGTLDLLAASPVSARQVFISKLGLVAIATLAMFALLWPLAMWLTGAGVPDSTTLGGMLGLWLLAAVEAIAWGTFFSMSTARPLVAVCLALATVSTIIHFLAWSAAPGRNYEFQFGHYLDVLAWRALIVMAVLAADVYLGMRWLHDPDAILRRTKSKQKRPRIEQPPKSFQIKQLVARPERGAMFGHLVWQHFRQSRRLMLLMAALQIGLVVLAMYSGLEQGRTLPTLALVPLVSLAALMGSCVFLADQERSQFRFFVEHNVPPRYVWLTRQLPWLSTLLVSSLVAGLFWAGPLRVGYALAGTLWPTSIPNLDSHVPALTWMFLGGATVTSIVVAYAAGQWTSMMVRSGLLAGFFGLLLALLLCGWAGLMLILHVGWWWSVWPIPLVLLWATWLRAPDWAQEKTTWLARGKAAAAVLVPAALLGILLPVNRVYSIPLVSPGFDERAYVAQVASFATEGRATADLYRRADDLYEPEGGFDQPQRSHRRSASWMTGENFAYLATAEDRAPSAKESAWLAANAEPLGLLLEASRRENCLLDDPRTATEARALRNASELISLLIASGHQLEAEGKLDLALDRYFTALTVISHWSQDFASRWILSASYSLRLSPADDVGRVLAELPHWAAQKGQTVERIRAAIDRVRSLDSDVLHLDDGLESAYLVARRFVMGDDAAAGALLGHFGDRSELTPEILGRKLMPWEKYREVRILNRRTRDELEGLRQMRRQLAAGEGIVDYFPVDDHPFFHFFERSPFQSASYALQQFGVFAAAELAEFEDWRGATLLLLSIESYRLEHGQLPDSLSSLVGPYLDELPHDPYSGLDFDYFPKGLPEMVSELDKAELVEPWYGGSIIPGVPCIWSTSDRLTVAFWHPSPTNPAIGTNDVGVETPQPAAIPYYVRRGEPWGQRLPSWGSGERLPDVIKWRLGHWFPIPPSAP